MAIRPHKTIVRHDSPETIVVKDERAKANIDTVNTDDPHNWARLFGMHDTKDKITGSGHGPEFAQTAKLAAIESPSQDWLNSLEPPPSSAYGDFRPGSDEGKVKDWVTSEDIDLTRNQRLAMHPDVMSRYPEWSMQNRFRDPRHPTRGIGYTLGTYANSALSSDLVQNALSGSPLSAALKFAIPAGLLAAGAGKLRDTVAGTSGSAKKWGLLAALLLGAGGAYASSLRNKAALPPSAIPPYGMDKRSFYRGLEDGDLDPRDHILTLLRQDSSVDFGLKSRMMTAIQALSQSQAEALSSALSFGGGAAAGALIAKFLFNAGLLGQVLGAFAGGYASRSMFGPQPQRTDRAGRPLFQ